MKTKTLQQEIDEAAAETERRLEAYDDLHASHERLRKACEATLLFYKGGDWNADHAPLWAELTEGREATTKSLCEVARNAIAKAKRIGLPKSTDGI